MDIRRQGWIFSGLILKDLVVNGRTQHPFLANTSEA